MFVKREEYNNLVTIKHKYEEDCDYLETAAKAIRILSDELTEWKNITALTNKQNAELKKRLANVAKTYNELVVNSYKREEELLKEIKSLKCNCCGLRTESDSFYNFMKIMGRLDEQGFED